MLVTFYVCVTVQFTAKLFLVGNILLGNVTLN